MRNTAQFDAECPDKDDPEWTRDDMARAGPASEVLPKSIGPNATEQLLRRGKGRPTREVLKVNQTVCIDPDVLAAYRRVGKGWRTDINETLRRSMPKHEK